MGAFLVAALCAAAEAQGENIVVRAGGDLQAAINAARPGDVILLQAGATFSGNFVLPDKGATTVDITIRSDSDSRLPAPGTRIGPAHAPLLATLRSPNTLAALTAVPRSHHWRLELLAFVANARGFGEIIALGSGDADQNDLSLVPHHLTLDRLLILGDPLIGQKRGIALNSASTTISNSHIADCKGAGFDTQAIGGWNGPGPYKITNNYLEGAGENFMLGGASPKIRDMIPADITFTRNHLTKPLAWKLPILQTPSAVTAAGSSGGSLAAGTYYYFVVAALPTAQDSWAWSAKSASVSATVGDWRAGDDHVERRREGEGVPRVPGHRARHRGPLLRLARHDIRGHGLPAGQGYGHGRVDPRQRLDRQEPLRAEGRGARAGGRQRVRARVAGVAERLRDPVHAPQPGQHVALGRGPRRHLLEQHRPPRGRRHPGARPTTTWRAARARGRSASTS